MHLNIQVDHRRTSLDELLKSRLAAVAPLTERDPDIIRHTCILVPGSPYEDNVFGKTLFLKLRDHLPWLSSDHDSGGWGRLQSTRYEAHGIKAHPTNTGRKHQVVVVPYLPYAAGEYWPFEAREETILVLPPEQDYGWGAEFLRPATAYWHTIPRITLVHADLIPDL